MRFVLGIAEAGFFPGVILYLTYWFPREHRARMVALFMTAVTLAGVIGSPISGWLLKTADDWHGLKAWQWLFILEGLPSVLIGLTVPFLLTDRPGKADWLSADEKCLLQKRIDAEEQAKANQGQRRHKAMDAFQSPQVWLCSLIYFGLVVGIYGASFWLPQIIENTLTQDKGLIGLYTAMPWACAAVGMVLVSRHSDRTGERRWHVSSSAFIAAAGFVISGLPDLPPLFILAALALAITGVMSGAACFWAIPTALLSGTAAAAGIALINSLGNLAGYLSPEMVAWLKTHYDMSIALDGIAALLTMSAILALVARTEAAPAPLTEQGIAAGCCSTASAQPLDVVTADP